ncbi:MAG: DNA mismatch repair protein MutS [Eubacteriales bacterium]
MSELTPMMRQYMDLKEKYNDVILLFRLGDFYEMFFEDAKIASRELEIVLTGRDCGLAEKAPMCGVPYHAVDGYINKLISKGYKVAICEQLTDPAESKGLVERDVTRVITPGTIIESSILDEKENNYIMSGFLFDNKVGFSYADISTGSFFTGEITTDTSENSVESFLNEVIRIQPKEFILNDALYIYENKINSLLKQDNILIECTSSLGIEKELAKEALLKHFDVESLECFSIEDKPYSVYAAGALMQYLKKTQKNDLNHITDIKYCYDNTYMILDASTRRNLELTSTIREGSKKGSLVWLLDKTKTAMGSRMIRNWLVQPLLIEKHINLRLDAVNELFEENTKREEIRDALNGVYDIERIISKISYGSLDARNCISLKQSLQKIPAIKKAISTFDRDMLKNLSDKLDLLEDIVKLLEDSIEENAPAGIKDGGIIKLGYNAEIDRLKNISQNSKEYILKLEKKEKEETGIKNLRIGYNRVFGYYIEVTRSNADVVPYRYQRRQTLANSERFITPELKQLEDEIISAEETCKKIEYLEFAKIRAILCDNISRIQQTANVLATIDSLASLAKCAYDNGYVRPQITDDGHIKIAKGRHPVVERMVSDFVANDSLMDTAENRMIIITGPNMAGKSTFMRQIGLITLMAQIGSFVPAESANLSIVDRIFTRVGASDDLASGQSTFMVEMNEVANILHNATSKSLIILDEIGRGTSTLDGLSIAWSVVEFICNTDNIGAKTLFATHYHELTELEGLLPGVKNYSVIVKEYGDDIIFLRKIKRGGTNKSFGIEVANLAGLPKEVINRAKEILKKLEQSDINNIDISSAVADNNDNPHQLAMFSENAEKEILDALKNVNVDSLTPLDALNLISELNIRVKRI